MTSTSMRIRSRTGVRVDTREGSVWIDVQEPDEVSSGAIFATPEGFDRLAAAATEAARLLRANQGDLPVARAS